MRCAVAYYDTWKPLCSVGWGGGGGGGCVSSGHKCKIQLNASPLLFRRTTMQKGGRIIEQILYMYTAISLGGK